MILILKRRKLIFKLASLLNTEFIFDSSGLFVWAKLRDTSKTSVEVVEEILQKYNLFIIPGSIFGTQGEGYIRFSLCVKAEEISKAIDRIIKKMKIGIIGVGLIGGSLAMSARQYIPDVKIYGSNRSKKTLDKSLEMGLIDFALTKSKI